MRVFFILKITLCLSYNTGHFIYKIRGTDLIPAQPTSFSTFVLFSFETSFSLPHAVTISKDVKFFAHLLMYVGILLGDAHLRRHPRKSFKI